MTSRTYMQPHPYGTFDPGYPGNAPATVYDPTEGTSYRPAGEDYQKRYTKLGHTVRRMQKLLNGVDKDDRIFWSFIDSEIESLLMQAYQNMEDALIRMSEPAYVEGEKL